MGRLIAPLLAFAAAAYIYTKNQGATVEFVYLFPMNNLFEDPVVAGQRSWQVLLVIGTIWLVSDIIALVRRRDREEKKEKAQSEQT